MDPRHFAYIDTDGLKRFDCSRGICTFNTIGVQIHVASDQHLDRYVSLHGICECFKQIVVFKRTNGDVRADDKYAVSGLTEGFF